MLFSAKDVLGSSVLPSVSLSMFTMASIARFTRSEMIEVLDSDYMLLAESKGISGPALIFRHALRNALIPIITVLAPLIVDLMTGSLYSGTLKEGLNTIEMDPGLYIGVSGKAVSKFSVY